MGKSSSSSKPKEPKMSPQEKTQLAASKAEWDHYKRQYQPIERQYLRDSARDHSDRAQAQATTGTMREATDTMRLAALGGGVSRAAGAAGGAVTEAGVRATGAERTARDDRMLGSIGVGREIATSSQRSLSGLARAGSQTAIGNMQNKLKVDSARSAARAQMVGSLAGAGAAMYMSGAGGKSSGNQTNFMNEADLRATSVQNQHEWAPPPGVRR